VTGPRPILLATRTRKARRPGTCALGCGRPVTIGQRIGLLFTGWAHVVCIVQANHLSAPKE
jgi:hypothetical protein